MCIRDRSSDVVLDVSQSTLELLLHSMLPPDVLPEGAPGILNSDFADPLLNSNWFSALGSDVLTPLATKSSDERRLTSSDVLDLGVLNVEP